METTSQKLSTEETLKRLLSKALGVAEAVGLEFHSERQAGESYLRVQVGKTFAKSPKSLIQNAGGFVRLNLVGDADEAVAGAANFLGLGNSQQPSPSSAP